VGVYRVCWEDGFAPKECGCAAALLEKWVYII